MQGENAPDGGNLRNDKCLTWGTPGLNIEVMDKVYLEYFLRMAISLTIGGLLGMQREIEGKPAGMRTNMLMCMGSCLLMILSIEISESGNQSADPSRIAAQIMTGIGFLGAGAILKARLTVTGLTSAATIWFVAAVGLTIGWGEYILGLTGTVLVLLTLNILGRLQHIVGGKQRRHILVFRFPHVSHRMQHVKRLFTHVGIHIDDIAIACEQEIVNVEIEYVAPEKKHLRVVAAIKSLDDVQIIVAY